MIAADDGDESAAERLLPLVFQQLRAAAQLQMAGERAGHTLQPTALVHEPRFVEILDRIGLPALTEGMARLRASDRLRAAEEALESRYKQ
jgi:hypothetical protein